MNIHLTSDHRINGFRIVAISGPVPSIRPIRCYLVLYVKRKSANCFDPILYQRRVCHIYYYYYLNIGSKTNRIFGSQVVTRCFGPVLIRPNKLSVIYLIYFMTIVIYILSIIIIILFF